MKRLLGGIVHLRRLRISNVFLLDGGPGDRWLVDSGHWIERGVLVREIARTGLAPREVTGILLTHRHSDHAGNACFLREKYGIKVYAHRHDAEILDGTVARPRMDPAGADPLVRIMVAFENRWPSRVPVDRALEDGESFGGFDVHWTPGHTEGSVFYRHGSTRTLLTGDSLLTSVPPLVLRRGLALAYKIFSTDREGSVKSVLSFHRAGHGYDNLLAGHGPPILGSARERVMEFLAKEGHE